MKNAINYHGNWLMPGSWAHKLHTEGRLMELKVHMKLLDIKDRELKARP